MVELQEAEVTEEFDTPPAPQTAGSLLRQAREAAGMQVFTLAGVLKVPASKVEALEAEDWKILPDPVFTRSLALGVCKALHIESAPVMALLPRSNVTQKFTAPGPGINEAFRDKALRSVHDHPSSGGAWKIAGLALVAGAVGAAWYFSQKQDLRDAVVASVQERSERAMATSSSAMNLPVEAPEEVAAEPVLAQEPVAPVVGEVTPAVQAGAAAVAAAGSVVVQPAAVVNVAETPSAAAAVTPVSVTAHVNPAETVLPAAAVPAQTAGSAAGPATLRIQARSETWIQVRGGGKVLEQKTLQAGEFFETQAPKPLSVVIGRAEAADVQVGGAAFDLASVARVNVARFEVK